jgi:hypothetical protein
MHWNWQICSLQYAMRQWLLVTGCFVPGNELLLLLTLLLQAMTCFS